VINYQGGERGREGRPHLLEEDDSGHGLQRGGVGRRRLVEPALRAPVRTQAHTQDNSESACMWSIRPVGTSAQARGASLFTWKVATMASPFSGADSYSASCLTACRAVANGSKVTKLGVKRLTSRCSCCYGGSLYRRLRSKIEAWDECSGRLPSPPNIREAGAPARCMHTYDIDL
jgi:hypothetical protein